MVIGFCIMIVFSVLLWFLLDTKLMDEIYLIEMIDMYIV